MTRHPLVIRRRQLKEVVGFSPSHVDRMEAAGQFPKRRKFGDGVVGWLYSEIQQSIESQQ